MPSRRANRGPLVMDAQPSSPISPSGAILEVTGLAVEYLLEGGTVRAVDNVSFSLDPGEFVAVVGESGCGKSTLLFAVAQLLSPPAQIAQGSVLFRGEDLVTMTDRDL